LQRGFVGFGVEDGFFDAVKKKCGNKTQDKENCQKKGNAFAEFFGRVCHVFKKVKKYAPASGGSD
jgi:hypothetical protein